MVPFGCSSEQVDEATQQPAAGGDPTKAAAPVDPLADKPIERMRIDLLHLAWQAASALPMEPHHKSRARAQQKVVSTCFEMEQPQLAMEFAKGIVGWRRGVAHADYAYYCIKHGNTEPVEQQLGFARQLAVDVKNDPNPQEWRRDTILMKVARCHALMGDSAKAAEQIAALDPNSGLAVDPAWAETVASRAELLTIADVDRELATMDASVESGGLGAAYSSIRTAARLFERFYADVEARSKIEQRVVAQYDNLPPGLRVQAIADMAAVAIDKDDRVHALQLLRDARKLFDGFEWSVEELVPLMGRLAALRVRAGERDEGKADAEAAMARYQDARDALINMYRPETLRPLAEAWHAMGESEQAGGIYAVVVEEGMENPHSRPRSEDISETCLSMAAHGFTPDAKLFARLREVVSGLGDPW